MKYGSVCSGIEAATVAWHGLGWAAAWYSEIEPFPCAVLAHHYPTVANLGDMTLLPERIRTGEVEAPDILCGGTPCQAFSVAGQRQSLADARGNLTLTFVEIADAIDAVRRAAGQKPAIVVWENVPGVLNTADNAFGCFLAGVAGESVPLEPPGGKWTDAGAVYGPARAVAWRVLDAQYFGLAQRRRRVFVVASARADFDPAAVLFEWGGMRRDSAPSREARESAARGAAAGAGGGGLGTDFNCDGGVVSQPYAVGNTLTARMHKGINTTLDEGQTPVLAFDTYNQTASDTTQTLCSRGDSPGGNAHLVPAVVQPYTLAIRGRGDGHNLEYRQDGTANALLTPNGGRGGIGVGAIAHAFDARQSNVIQYGDKTEPLDTDGHSIGVVIGTDCYNGSITGDVAATLGTPGSSVNASGPTVMQPVGVFQDSEFGVQQYDSAGTLRAGRIPEHQMVMQPVAFRETADCLTSAYGTKWNSNASASNGSLYAHQAMQVRRLTPRECERLQGFPDDYTAIPWRGKPASDCPDGPRYKALGNSWAVPVVRWIGQRIADATNPQSPPTVGATA